MAALTAERSTIRKGQEPNPGLHELPVKASTKVIAGGIAVLDAGYLAPGRTATGLITLGRFEETIDNTGGGAGALSARVLSGEFWYGNSTSADLIAQANVGADCYVVDDQTVALTSASSTRSKAGKIVEVDSVKGVLVLMGFAVV